jgi:hypothetical protein
MRAVTVVLVGLAIAVLATDGLANGSGQLKLATGGGQYSYGTGGEFKVSYWTESGTSQWVDYPDGIDVGNTSFPYFQTFCVEHDETFNPGVTFDWKVNTKTVHGGVTDHDPLDRAAYETAAGGGDLICPETAYLYYEFWNGTLGTSYYTYTLGANRALTAGDLQYALWFLEGELGDPHAGAASGDYKGTLYNSGSLHGGDSSRSQNVRNLIDLAFANAGTSDGFKYVRVLNLYNVGTSTARQDQLCVLTDNGVNEVPLPPAAPLGLALLCGLGVYTRFRRRRHEV